MAQGSQKSESTTEDSPSADTNVESGLRLSQRATSPNAKFIDTSDTDNGEPPRAPGEPEVISEEQPGRKLGLKAKLLLMILPLVNLALLAIWIVSTMTARSGLMDLSSRNLSTASHDLAGALGDALSDAYADARTTAALDLPAQAIETGDAKNMTWYANELVKTKSKYVAIIVTDLEGTIVSANTIDRLGKKIAQPLIGQKLPRSKWFTEAIASKKGKGALVPPGRPQTLLPLLGATGRAVGFSMPVFDIMDDAVGTVTAFVSMDFLAKRLVGLTHADAAGIHSLAAIVDGKGGLLALPPGMTGSMLAWQGAQWPNLSETPVVQWTGPGNTPFFLSQEKLSSSISDLSWRLATMRTVASVEAPVTQMGQTLLWVSILIVLLATGAIALAAGRIVGPISRLTVSIQGTGRAADFKPVRIETRDEVGVLAQAFNRMFQTIVDHEQNLERRVEERTAQLALAKREVSDILDNMQQGVFTVSAGSTIDPQYSAYSQELFGDVTIEGADLLTLLQISIESCGQEEYSRMRFWLETIHGSDDFQWMLSADEGLPRIEYNWSKGEEKEVRIIELEYAPIYDDAEEIRKVMVLARDVTALEALKEEVVAKDQENSDNIDRAAELSNLDADLFATFISESAVLLGECNKAIEGLKTSGGDKKCIDQLFRSMHTLKGNSRIFKITRVQDKAHLVENQFEELRESGESLNLEQIAQVEENVGSVAKELASFESLGRRVLLGEKASDSPISQGAFEFVDRSLQQIPEWQTHVEGIEDNDGNSLGVVRRLLQAFSSEVDLLGLTSLTAATAATIELLEYEQPLKPAVIQLLGELEEALRAARLLASDLKGSEDPESFLVEATQIVSRMDTAVTYWDLDVEDENHVHALLRHIDSLIGIAATDKLDSIHLHASNLGELLGDVRDCGVSAFTPQTVQEVRARVESLRALIEDGYAFVGHHSPYGGALAALRRMVLGLDHQFLNWNRTFTPGNSAQAVYHRAHDCQVELQARGLFWLAGEARILESALEEIDRKNKSARLSERTTVRVEQRFVLFLSKYRLLKDLGTELRSRRNPSHALQQIRQVAQRVEPRSSETNDTAWANLLSIARELRLPTIEIIAQEKHASGLRDCVGVLHDAQVLVDVASTSKEKGEALSKVSESRLTSLLSNCSNLSQLMRQSSEQTTSQLRENVEKVAYDAWSLTAASVGPLFARMRKMVFTLGVELDRGVEELRFDGANILVDRPTLDKVRDILIHTLRNSVDHGIESRQKREMAGKPSRGKISIQCKEKNGTVTLVVKDDGGGIDLVRVREKALSKGLVTPEDAKPLSEDELLALIFRPGFSTNTQVTDVSGRGVGMDVVKCTVEELGGTIKLSTALGRGTTTHITLPARMQA